jgi:hypothetical protein
MHILKQQIKLLIGVTFLGLVGCDLLQVKDEDENSQAKEVAVARVHNAFLYKSDLEGMVLAGTSKSDSIARVERYINNWVRKQLLIDEAKSKIDFNEADLERKIQNYRYSLIAYQYQSFYINQHIDKNVNEEEIESYYESNQDNFPLKQNIIRGKFVKAPENAPKLNQVKRLIQSSKEKDKEKLQEFCFGYASNFTLVDSIWINYDDLVRGSPFAETPNTVQFLRNRKYAEAADESYKYFLKITEYKKTDDISPLEVVRDQIVDIIINKRKIALAENLEKEVYNEAKQKNSFEIYN